ncbi:hypothetical protein [Massilia sp.]|uniref:hypothetical protein n=1 Tax=Massilia sp. TaxID=1882437 RepID=UPI002897AD0D|nr:hypothetical protein [Massilia sp.]
MQQQPASNADNVRSTSIIAASQSRLSPIPILLLASLCVMLPVWLIGLPFSGHDAPTHLRWQTLFAAQFWNGDLYPRWLVDINRGLGSPAFFIYPPLPHFVAALLAPLSDGIAWTQQRLGISAALALFVGSTGAYLWLRELTRERVSALCGALVFLLSPYHLFLDTYHRAAYAELWAFAWAPFSLWAIHLIARNPARGVFVYSLATAALALSHAPSCLVLPPLYVIYAALLSYSSKRKDIFLWTCAASAAAIMIAAVYLATALTHQGNINDAALYTGFFEFDRWLLLSGRWQGGELAISGITVVQFGALFLLGALALRSARLDAGQRMLVIAAIAGSVFLLFMMTIVAAPVWKLIPAAQKIQFPWRLLTAQTMLLSLVAALYVLWARGAGDAPRGMLRRLALPLLAALFAVNAGLTFLGKPAFERNPDPGGADVPEYRMGDIANSSGLFEQGSAIRTAAGEGSARLERLAPRHLRIHLDARTDVRLIVRQFYYPGWECAGNPAGCAVSKHSPETPVLTIDAGAGRREIDIVLAQTPSERIGALASWSGLLVLAVLCLLARFWSARQNNRR